MITTALNLTFVVDNCKIISLFLIRILIYYTELKLKQENVKILFIYFYICLYIYNLHSWHFYYKLCIRKWKIKYYILWKNFIFYIEFIYRHLQFKLHFKICSNCIWNILMENKKKSLIHKRNKIVHEKIKIHQLYKNVKFSKM